MGVDVVFMLCCVSLFYSCLKIDIDECSSSSHSCDVNAVCNNTHGSYTCTCKAGYSGNGKSCTGEFLKVHLTPNFLFGRDETLQHSHKEFDNIISIWYF